MTTLTVEVPDHIANKFKSYTIVNYKLLFSEVEKENWTDFDVNMSADNFLIELDKEVLCK